jgi:hypothetical protein
MVTFLAALVAGILSSVITLVFGQPLQHYFWTRQRQAERQLAIINDVHTLAAELQFLLRYKPEDIIDRQERLYSAFHRVATSVETLFSEVAADRLHVVSEPMEYIMRLREPRQLAERPQLDDQLLSALLDALAALYQDVGIPTPPPAQWMRVHAWQPLQVRIWDHPRQYWRVSGWPTLQRWGAQARTRWHR